MADAEHVGRLRGHRTSSPLPWHFGHQSVMRPPLLGRGRAACDGSHVVDEPYRCLDCGGTGRVSTSDDNQTEETGE